MPASPIDRLPHPAPLAPNANGQPPAGVADARQKILDAAALLFFSRGYEGTTTLAIAGQASVSKRTLYACFGTKQGILEALIESGAEPMHQPLKLVTPHSAGEFFDTLTRFAQVFLTELFSASKVAMYRLAIADATRGGVVAHQLEASGSAPVTAALLALFDQALQAGLIRRQDPRLLMTAFFGMLVGDIHMRLVMGTIAPLAPDAIAQRVEMAMTTVRRLCALDGDR